MYIHLLASRIVTVNTKQPRKGVAIERKELLLRCAECPLNMTHFDAWVKLFVFQSSCTVSALIKQRFYSGEDLSKLGRVSRVQ